MKKFNFTFPKSLKHLLLIVVVIAIFTPATYAKPPTMQQINTLSVIDANGKTVGTIIGMYMDSFNGKFGSMVLLSVNNHPVVLQVSTSGLSGNQLSLPGPLFFSTDCSGTPFILIAGSCDLVDLCSVTNGPNKTLYISEPNTLPESVNAFSGSFLDSDGSCVSVPFDGITVIQAIKLIDLNTLFTPPFSVQGR